MADRELTAGTELHALLGPGAEFSGKLTFMGRVRIDGKLDGEIFGDEVLIIGDGAEVRAEVEVGTLIMRGGTLWGNVRATQLVELHAPARLYGNVQTPQIFVDKGVVFDGRCAMLNAEAEIE